MAMLIYSLLVPFLLLTVIQTIDSRKSHSRGKNLIRENCVKHSDCPSRSACMLAGYGSSNEKASKKCFPCTCAKPSQCYFKDKRTKCNCTGSGFTGKNCKKNIDDCADVHCLNRGTCEDGINSYTCICDLGFVGQNCEINVNECKDAPCKNGGTCIDGANSYICNCVPGYSGQNCEKEIDECADKPCLNGGSCNDGVNSYTCDCEPGYSGQNCETDIDECLISPCLNGGTCVDGVNEFTCTCRKQFTGQFCETDNPVINIAIGKPSYQISVYEGRSSWYAANGNDGNYNTCFHTDNALNPWWEVNLLDLYCISQIQIFNKVDCCVDRAQNVEISVATTSDDWTVVAYQPGQMGIFLFLTFEPVEAQYVRVTLRNTQTWLHFCEVEIFGCD